MAAGSASALHAKSALLVPKLGVLTSCVSRVPLQVTAFIHGHQWESWHSSDMHNILPKLQWDRVQFTDINRCACSAGQPLHRSTCSPCTCTHEAPDLHVAGHACCLMHQKPRRPVPGQQAISLAPAAVVQEMPHLTGA